jgi:hypothetical protein
VEVACPSCGTLAQLAELNRDASSFCTACDFPLFWSRSGAPSGEDGGDAQAGLRRLPGTAGRVAVASVHCPSCNEPNPVMGTHCIRCGADLHPVPVEEPPAPVPEPEAPVVEPRRRPAWLLPVCAVIIVLTVMLVVAVVASLR